MNCRYCTNKCVKRGFYKTKQRYQCMACKKYQLLYYNYEREKISTAQIVQLNNEGMGINSIARIIKASATTVQRRMLKAASKLPKPIFNETEQEYEVDEMHTYVGRNSTENYTYITYAINRKTKKIIDFIVGKRNTITLSKVIHTLLSLSPIRIYTDKLNIYPLLIDKKIHKTEYRKTNYIERRNLSVRQHLKRLSRKTLSFTKSAAMLSACFRLYAWSL